MKVNVPQHGQHVKANWFCVNCHAIGSIETHYPDCTNRKAYAIPTSAEVPKKDANKKKWDLFKQQFVYAEPIGWWSHYESSWWAKNKITETNKQK